MAPLKCCITGCKSTSDFQCLFSLPKDDKLRSLWMSYLLPFNPQLIGLTKEQLLRKQVCQKHFDRYQMDGQGRRIRCAYPCLFSAKEIAHGVPLSLDEYHVLTEHNYHQQDEEDDDNDRTMIIGKAGDDHAYASCSAVQVNREPVNSHSLEYKDVSRTLEMPSCSNDNSNIQVVLPTPKASHKCLGSSRMKLKYNREVKTIAVRSLGKASSQRLHEAQNLIQTPDFLNKFESLSKQAQTLLIMQLKLVRKNKMARRFTIEEKLLALTLMKQSPKGYKLLEKMFALPTKRTLNRLAEKICFEPGINHKVFKYVKEMTKTWETKKKLCTILFDEVALSPHLTFNESKDVIHGFVELSGGKKPKYCDHALVFMVRGICSPWRQCLAYYFCEGTVPAIDLVQILEEMVSQVTQTGLLPLGLVCDQGSTFRTALNKIRQDTVLKRNTHGNRDYGSIEIAGWDLNIFHDPPHLIKSIRNNFLTKDMMFEGKMGSWKDIMFIYDIDSKLGHTRALPKLMSHHIIPKKIKKMKVSVATQALSARTAAMLKYTNALNIANNPTMGTTAEIVEFFDRLFDSVNGSPGTSKRGKLRCAVKRNSPHIEFWQNAIRILKTIKFVDHNSKKALKSGKPLHVSVPCLEGWIKTLESFIRMSKLLLDKYDIEYFYPRYLNQDPLENFFGRIRAINYRNVNPDAHTFICSYKTLVLSNLLSPHSQFYNCEEDDGETLIGLNYLFDEESNKENVFPNMSPLPSSSSQDGEGDSISQVMLEKIKVQCSAYTAGYICRKLSKSINCKKCTYSYTTSDIDAVHTYIQYREYKSLKRSNLAYPNGHFLRLYRDAAQFIHKYLNIYSHNKNVGQNIRNHLMNKMRYSWLGCCAAHNKELFKKFIVFVIRLQVHNWCRIINKILNGQIEEKYVKKMDDAQKRAYVKYEKFRLRQKVKK